MKCFLDSQLNIFAQENRIALLFLGVAVLTGASAVAYASVQVETGRQAYQSVKNHSRQGAELTHKHLDDLAFLNTNEKLFVRWLDSGKIGQKDAMDWVELMLDVSGVVDAREFQYQLGPVEPIDTVHGRVVEYAAIHEGAIKLAFTATHGADVFRFFSEMRGRAPGAFKLQDLKIARIENKKISQAVRYKKVGLNSWRDSSSPAGSLLETERLVDQVVQEIPAGFSGVKVNATLKWFQIELAAK